MEDLAQLVHSQHEIVDSIEEQVERSAHEVQQGNRQLKQAVRSNQGEEKKSVFFLKLFL